MALSAGICPKCNENLLLKGNIPFLVCPLCAGNISTREALALLDAMCADSKKISANIAKCLSLEKKYGPQMPAQILMAMQRHFPNNEEIAYLALKMSGFPQSGVRGYLQVFASVAKPVAFATAFLDKALVGTNLYLGDLFEKYINNKLKGVEQKRYIAEILAVYQ